MDPILKIERNASILYITWYNAKWFNLDHESIERIADNDFDSWALVGIQHMDDVVILKILIKSWHYKRNYHLYYYVDEVMDKLHLFRWENVDQECYGSQ